MCGDPGWESACIREGVWFGLPVRANDGSCFLTFSRGENGARAASGESRRKSLGQHKLRRVPLSGDSVVRKHKAGRIHDTKKGPRGRIPSGVWEGLPVEFGLPNSESRRSSFLAGAVQESSSPPFREVSSR